MLRVLSFDLENWCTVYYCPHRPPTRPAFDGLRALSRAGLEVYHAHLVSTPPTTVKKQGMGRENPQIWLPGSVVGLLPEARSKRWLHLSCLCSAGWPRKPARSACGCSPNSVPPACRVQRQRRGRPDLQGGAGAQPLSRAPGTAGTRASKRETAGGQTTAWVSSCCTGCATHHRPRIRILNASRELFISRLLSALASNVHTAVLGHGW